MEQRELLRLEPNPIHPPHFNVALEQVRKHIPEQESALRPVLERTDQQGIDHFSIFQSQAFPGVEIPFTRVSVSSAPADAPKITYVIIPGWSWPPDWHPFTGWEVVYDRVIGSLPQSRSKNIEVYSMGSPNAFGGKVSQQWVESLKTGFSPYGEIYAEFISRIIDQGETNRQDRVILNGISLGATIAELAARSSLLQRRQHLQLLLDSPISSPSHNLMLSVIKALQIPLGFLGEAVARLSFDERKRIVQMANDRFLKQLGEVLKQRGIDTEDSRQQLGLKRKAALIDVWNMIKGTPWDTENTRSFIRRGMLDPVTFSPFNLLRIKTLRQKAQGKNTVRGIGKSLEFGIASTHSIERYRIEKWGRMVKYASPSK